MASFTTMIHCERYACHWWRLSVHGSVTYLHERLQFMQQPGGQSDILWCYCGLKWTQIRKLRFNIPNVSTLPSSVFIRGYLKLLRDSYYALTNQRFFHYWGVNRCQVKGCHHHIPFWNICNSRVAFISFCTLAKYIPTMHLYSPVSCVETFFMFKEKPFLPRGSPYCILVFALSSMFLPSLVHLITESNGYICTELVLHSRVTSEPCLATTFL